jgi:hypothetical protein
MKFIKITTKHNSTELNDIFNKLSPTEVEYIKNLYSKFEYFEFNDVDDSVCMFASIHPNYISDLLESYVKLSINFKYEDITKDVLYSKLDFKIFESEDLTKMIDNFIKENLDVDTVLDKINEFGRDSLLEIDMLVLSNF